LAERPEIARLPLDPSATAQPTSRRTVIFAGADGAASHDTPIFAREQLVPGVTFDGPAIVTQYDTTTVLPPNWRAAVDETGSLILERVSED